MDVAQTLEAFDAQVRRCPAVASGSVVERDTTVVRLVSTAGGWTGVTWSELRHDDADAVIAEQIHRFARLGASWEWKLYSYDEPADLGRRLGDAGFIPGPTETVLVADLTKLDLHPDPPAQITLRPVVDDGDLVALGTLHDLVFGGDHAGQVAELAAALRASPPAAVAFIAWADRVAVSAGRLELHPGTDFASLWGGGTLPQWRGQGIFRALVAARAQVARAHGCRYLQTDATAASAPILRRLGFVELAITTPYTYEASGRSSH